MADKEAKTETIRQAAIEAAKAVVIAVVGADAGAGPRSKPVSMQPKLSGSILRQSTFDWSGTDKYTQLRNFRLKVNNIFETYNMDYVYRVSIIKHLLGKQSLHLLSVIFHSDCICPVLCISFGCYKCNAIVLPNHVIPSLRRPSWSCMIVLSIDFLDK